MDFRRIDRFPPYVFSIVNDLKMRARRGGEDIVDIGMGNPDIPTPEAVGATLKAPAGNPASTRRARRGGEDIVDLGMGNPDIPTPEAVVDKLKEAAENPRNHRYSASKGIPKLRHAICDHYERTWGVTLDP